MQTFRSWWWEILCGLLYLALAGGQVAKDQIIGMADNGDFPKVLGRQDVCDSHIYAQYMAPAYKTGPECRWDSHLTSSEAVFLKIVKQIAAWNLEYEIAIQAEGKAHLIVVMAALAVLLWALRESRPPVRFGLPLLIILIFSDVAYVSYLNSFYMDAAAMVFLMLTISLAVAAALRPRAWIAIAFGIAAVLFITSKSQHGLLGPLLSALAAWFAFRSARKTALLWTASAIAALLSTVVMVKLTTLEYRTYPLYNIIFFSLAKESPHPEQTLTELGLPPSYLPLVGSHSYAANNPSSSGPWEAERNLIHQEGDIHAPAKSRRFGHRFGKVLQFLVRVIDQTDGFTSKRPQTTQLPPETINDVVGHHNLADHVFWADLADGIGSVTGRGAFGGFPYYSDAVTERVAKLVETRRCVRMEHDFIVGYFCPTHRKGKIGAISGMIRDPQRSWAGVIFRCCAR